MSNMLVTELIEKILANKFRSDRAITDRITEEMRIELNMPQTIDEITAAMNKAAYERMAEVMAPRLVANDRSIPLICVDDFEELLLRHAETKFPNKFQHEREAIIRVAKPAITTLFLSILKMADGSDPYDHYWKVVNTIASLADVSQSLNQPLSEDLYDEVTRRVYSREAYVNQINMSFGIVSDPEKLVRLILDSMNLNETQRLMSETEILGKLHLQVKPMFEKMLPVMHRIVDNEVNRIYS